MCVVEGYPILKRTVNDKKRTKTVDAHVPFAVIGLVYFFVIGKPVRLFRTHKISIRVAGVRNDLILRQAQMHIYTKKLPLGRSIWEPIVILDRTNKNNLLVASSDLGSIHLFQALIYRVGDPRGYRNDVMSCPSSFNSVIQREFWLGDIFQVNNKGVSDDFHCARWNSTDIGYVDSNDSPYVLNMGVYVNEICSFRNVQRIPRRCRSALCGASGLTQFWQLVSHPISLIFGLDRQFMRVVSTFLHFFNHSLSSSSVGLCSGSVDARDVRLVGAYCASDDSDGSQDASKPNQSVVKLKLLLFVLIVAVLRFSGFLLKLIEASIKNGDSAFVVNYAVIIMLLVIGQFTLLPRTQKDSRIDA